jgi:thiol-disulfide isomerase/thioredoxin
MKRTAVIGFFCVLLLCGSAVSEPQKGLILTELAGEKVEVDSLLKTGPVVLNFWATWCKPCRLEMPHLQGIYEELKAENVHFAAISLDQPRQLAKVGEYVAKQEISLPIYHDTGYILAKRFKVMGIPTTILLDQQGEIVHRTRGYRPGDEVILKKKIESLINVEEG